MANDNPFAPKPLVNVNLVTEFGGVEETDTFKSEGAGHRDYTYVPGSSEARVKRDLALGALARNEIRAKDVPVLEHNCYWFRTNRGSGNEPDMMRLTTARNSGYRPATKDDVGKPWMTALPPGAHVAPDGTVRSSGGDLALYVTDQQNAARNAMRKKRATEEQMSGFEFTTGGLGDVGPKAKSDPTVVKTIGEGGTK